MVLKRTSFAALGALGAGALVTGPVAAQDHIPAPEILQISPDICEIDDGVLDMQDPTVDLNLTACADVNKLVTQYRNLWEDADTTQGELSRYTRQANADDRISTAEQQRLDFLTDERDKARDAKNEFVGNALADAVYAEQDQMDALQSLKNDRDDAEDGHLAARKSAILEHHNYLHFYEDADGNQVAAWLAPFDDMDEVESQTQTNGYERPDTTAADFDLDPDGDNTDAVVQAESLVEQVRAARATWNGLSDPDATNYNNGLDDPYDDDGDLIDFEEMTLNAKNAAVALSMAERRLADAKKEASSQVTALARAESQLKQANDAIKDQEMAVNDAQRTLASRAKGAGDSAATRLAEVRAERQREYNRAADDLDDAQEDLDDAQGEFDDAEGDLEDAEDDLASAQARYDAAQKELADALAANEAEPVGANDPFTDEQITALTNARDAAALQLAAADKSVVDADADVRRTRMALMEAQNNYDDEAEVAMRLRERLDEALAGDFEFVNENPAGALLDALVQQEDTGGALVDAVDSLHGATVANAAAIAEIGVTGSEVAANTAAIATNTADIADHETRISDNEDMLMDHEGRITANETMLMDHEGRITTNEATLADHGMKLMQKKEYIDNLGMHIGVDPVTGMGTGQGGMSRIDMNEANIASNRDFIEHNHEHILEHSALIESNQMSIMRNTEDIQTLKSGVAASMALAGMPEMGARGVSVGAGSYGGETALAVGVHFSGENARFKIGVTSSGGETGASLGAGWSF